MGTMFAQFFITITTLFSATEKAAKALDHIAGWAEQSAGTFADEAAIKRQASHAALLQEFNITPALESK